MGELDGMTQARWDSLSHQDRERLRDLSGLHPQLKQWQGWRVEVVDADGETRRFIVGQSTGWRPCTLEISRRSAHGGPQADSRPFKSVKPLYKR